MEKEAGERTFGKLTVAGGGRRGRVISGGVKSAEAGAETSAPIATESGGGSGSGSGNGEGGAPTGTEEQASSKMDQQEQQQQQQEGGEQANDAAPVEGESN